MSPHFQSKMGWDGSINGEKGGKKGGKSGVVCIFYEFFAIDSL